jgi:Predicted transcriptional regulators
MSIGENIKARRLAMGMTQEDLACAVGLGRSMVAQIERGSKIPNVILARDISRVLQCDLNDLVGG